MRAYGNIAPLPVEPDVIVVPPSVRPWFIDNPEHPEQAASVPPSSSVLPSSESESWTGGLNLPGVQENITLTNYRRTSETTHRCFVPNCVNPERQRIPRYLKRAILKNQKLYITPNARVCQNHSVVYNWENILNEFEFVATFNSSQIESMLNLLSSAPNNVVLNFEDIENANDNVCHYWTGLDTIKFLYLFRSVPQLNGLCKKAKSALGMYLVKLRTGESMARMASLFLVGKGTVCTYIKKVRNCLSEHYVPIHLGLNHLTRAAHSARNLLIPQGLFGTEEINPIVICDGTYIYIQKSSNYLFQKKTWSLHKYQNLVKPFLMVACDGHIIEVLGPYAATQSDADIMKAIFESPESPMRSYFRQNDVFILDRGFRDAIGLLTSLQYLVHKPESLDVGETQLSTIKANKSRCVTLCRWVVEVVNGRFKRDFKLFRNKYFNIYSRNLMPDFKIAAALLNNFHPVITDHPDAQHILNRALSRLEMPNLLADSVIRGRINRDRTNFVNINAQLPELHVFPVMEMRDLILFGLGIYQIKQARSYYGEHIRQNGSFRIEVDTNLDRFPPNKLLLRGKIRSRHTSNRQYFTYILLNLNGQDWCQRIEEYYCTCIIGKRTVGSCAHVMTIVWYLGWARHQDNVQPPASFLDGILVREDVENEIE